MAYQWKSCHRKKEPPRSTRITGAKISLNEQDSEKVEKEKTQRTENFLKKTEVGENKWDAWALRETVEALKPAPIPGPTRVSTKSKPSHPIMATELNEGSG